MRDVKREERPTDLVCDRVRQADGHQVGPARRVPRLQRLPRVQNTKNFTRDEDGTIRPVEPEITDETCEKCGKPMQVRFGRFGKFLGCSGYPECKNVQPLFKPMPTGIKCLVCGEGEMLERRSRRGKVFYSCNRYPDCTFVAWDKPVARAVSALRRAVRHREGDEAHGTVRRCAREGCDWQVRFDEDANAWVEMAVPRAAAAAQRASRRRGSYGSARAAGAGGREARSQEGRGQGRRDDHGDHRRQGRQGDRARRRRRAGAAAGVDMSDGRERVTIIGGGLAGCEAAWQLARAGVGVDLYEMRPERGTAAHQTDQLGELVCSNSFRNATLRDRGRAPEGGDAAARLARHAGGRSRTRCRPARVSPSIARGSRPS